MFMITFARSFRIQSLPFRFLNPIYNFSGPCSEHSILQLLLLFHSLLWLSESFFSDVITLYCSNLMVRILHSLNIRRGPLRCSLCSPLISVALSQLLHHLKGFYSMAGTPKKFEFAEPSVCEKISEIKMKFSARTLSFRGPFGLFPDSLIWYSFDQLILLALCVLHPFFFSFDCPFFIPSGTDFRTTPPTVIHQKFSGHMLFFLLRNCTIRHVIVHRLLVFSLSNGRLWLRIKFTEQEISAASAYTVVPLCSRNASSCHSNIQ